MIGEAGNGSVQINTGPDSGLDADTLDGAQGEFYLNAGNMNAGFLKKERLNGTYDIIISGQSGSTLRLRSSTNSPTGNPTPDEFSTGIIADTKNNTADGLFDGGTRHVVMTIRNGGIDFDATFGGVKQLAFTDANADVGAGMWLRGSFNSPANSFGNWHEIWHSGNDGVLSGLDADKLDGRQGTWYQSAQHMDFGYLSNERLPVLQREKDFLSKLRVMDWTGNVRVNVLVRDELLNATPFLVGQSVNLYTPSGIARGSISITKIEPTQDTNDAANNFTRITGSLTSGDFTSFDDAEFIGTGGVGNAFRFQNWNVAQVDDNADGDIDGTYEVISGESVSGNARLRLGRTDGQASDPSIFFRSSALAASDYNVAFIASGGGSTNGSGSLELKVGNNNAFTINGNKIWNEGNITFNSTNVVGTGVIRDQNGNFEAGTITASLTGAASANVLKGGDTMTGALTISGVPITNQALQVSGRADFLSNITVADDFKVGDNLIFADDSLDRVGIDKAPDSNDGKFNLYAPASGGNQLNVLNLRVMDNNYDQGISFQNSGAAYTWNIVRKNNTGAANTAHLVFRGQPNAPQSVITDLVDYMTLFSGGDVQFGVGDTGIGTAPDSDYKLKVDGEIYADTSIYIRNASNNDGAPLYFLGATGGADGSGGYLSNFRVGNSLIGNDIFEITANNGPSGATTWKSTPALAIQGTNNRVAINTTTFQGQDNTDPNNIITRFYALNIEGNFNINNGNLFVDNKPFVTSRWTEAPNNTDIYRPTKVGINFSSAKNPTESLDVEGSIDVSGTLKANGQAQWIDSYGVIKTSSATVNEDISIPSGNNAFSFGPIGVGTNNIITIQTGAIWVIL